MAGLVPAIGSGTVPRQMAGTSPAMTEGTSGDGRSLVRAARISSVSIRLVKIVLIDTFHFECALQPNAEVEANHQVSQNLAVNQDKSFPLVTKGDPG
jgi:hypothetical protein